jgi:PmbA protein
MTEAAEATRLEEIATRLVEQARRQGADIAEATVSSGWELSAKVRLGEPELVQEAGQRNVALRVIRDQRVAITSTSDWTEAGLEQCVRDALELVQLSEPDSFAGAADPELLSRGPYPDLDLFDESLDQLGADEALKRAEDAERIALGQDSRLTNSEGATFSRVSGWSALVLSSGFSAVRRGSFASLAVVPVVEDAGGKKRRGHYWTGHRHLSGLESSEIVGRKAAERTLRQLGARKVPTCRVPIVFDADAARSLLSSFVGCALGGSIWRRSSYLADREGTQVASPLVQIVDDPLIPRGPGSRVFDGEGLAARRNVVVENGILRTFLLDSYCARKLGKLSTASAGRSGGGVGATTSNLLLSPGQQSPEELIASTPRGLFVTEMMGFGFNAVTGDFSRGAAGFWIEDGKLAFPVSEITISSNLDDMLKNIDAIANDLVLKTSLASPSLRVSEMTIAGEDNAAAPSA